MSIIRKKLDLKLKMNAYPFQKDAFDEIKDKNYFAIFHEQGLGKTKIAIDVAFYWLETQQVDSVLICTKKSLIQNWKDELERHGNVPPLVLTSNKSTNSQNLGLPGSIYLCNYELIRDQIDIYETFFQIRKMGVILDESTQIKNPASKTAKSFHRLGKVSQKKIIMTGTPISNRPYDIWSQIYFLDEGERLGRTFDDFKEEYDLGNDLNNDTSGQIILKNNLKLLSNKIRDCSVRETKKTAGIELPGRRFIVEKVLMDAKQKILYEKLQIELSAEVLRDGQLVTEDVEVILKRLLRLVQISSNPKLVDENYHLDAPKTKKTEEIIDKAQQENSKVLIWTNFIKNVDYLAQYFSKKGALGIHGGMSTEYRNSSISRFKKDSDVKILIATPGVAKEGLTLVEANYAIFFDRNFSLENYLQAQDRIYRISQTKDCYIYKLLSEGSIDLWVDALLEAKEVAARFGQGDISEKEYNERINFNFSEILHDILLN
jgi:SNF2 family DNA or RNA helicase